MINWLPPLLHGSVIVQEQGNTQSNPILEVLGWESGKHAWLGQDWYMCLVLGLLEFYETTACV